MAPEIRLFAIMVITGYILLSAVIILFLYRDRGEDYLTARFNKLLADREANSADHLNKLLADVIEKDKEERLREVVAPAHSAFTEMSNAVHGLFASLDAIRGKDEQRARNMSHAAVAVIDGAGEFVGSIDSSGKGHGALEIAPKDDPMTKLHSNGHYAWDVSTDKPFEPIQILGSDSRVVAGGKHHRNLRARFPET